MFRVKVIDIVSWALIIALAGVLAILILLEHIIPKYGDCYVTYGDRHCSWGSFKVITKDWEDE